MSHPEKHITRLTEPRSLVASGDPFGNYVPRARRCSVLFRRSKTGITSSRAICSRTRSCFTATSAAMRQAMPKSQIRLVDPRTQRQNRLPTLRRFRTGRVGPAATEWSLSRFGRAGQRQLERPAAPWIAPGGHRQRAPRSHGKPLAPRQSGSSANRKRPGDGPTRLGIERTTSFRGLGVTHAV
jgi:hypothetical protein